LTNISASTLIGLSNLSVGTLETSVISTGSLVGLTDLTLTNISASTLVGLSNLSVGTLETSVISTGSIISPGFVSSNSKNVSKYPLIYTTIQTNITSANGTTISATEFLNGFINRTNITPNEVDTLPDASELNNYPNTTTGMVVECLYYTDNIMNIVAGSGGGSLEVTLSANSLNRITILLTGSSSYIAMVNQ
jgi:hypothetical protein